MHVIYRLEPNLDVDSFIDVLQRSTLAERRPVDRLDIIAGMLRQADVIVTARIGETTIAESGVRELLDDEANEAVAGAPRGKLVGISRAITDFHYCTYLSDLAVDQEFQRQGIGRELIRRTHVAAGLQTMLILLSAPKATAYYPHIGMTQHPSCWYLPRSVPASP